MAEHLAECFIYLRSRGLAPQPLAKLRLNHAERRFYVTAFVIVLIKLIPLEIVVEDATRRGAKRRRGFNLNKATARARSTLAGAASIRSFPCP